MPTNELAYFTDSVNTLIQGKLILVDKHIASVLQCVATSPTLKLALSEAVKTMSYATEFSRARVSWRRADGVVESRLKLPLDRNRMFAFVVCLLTEVDSGRRNLLEFLKEYYDDVNNDASYAKFADEVLKPFKQAGEAILSTIDPESLNAHNVEQAERFFKAEKIYVDTASLTRIFAEMDAVRRLASDMQLPDEVKLEFDAASEFLVNALYLKNPRVLSVSLLAYKNTARQLNGSAQHLQAIADILNGVLK